MIEVSKSNPLVSILVPTWNRAAVIYRTIESALNQSYTNIEIIVTDNASSDGTLDIVNELARKDSRITVLRNKTNVGAIPNWRRALEASRGDYIKFLWSDDFLEETTVEELLKPLLHDKAIGFTICPAMVESPYGVVGRPDFTVIQDINIWSFLTSQIFRYPSLPVSPMAALVRRDLVLAAFQARSPVLENECEKRAIGRDLLILYFGLALGLRGRKVTTTYVHFWDGHDSITHNTHRNDLSLCYTYAIIELLKLSVASGEVLPHILRSRLIVLLRMRTLAGYVRGRALSSSLKVLWEFAANLPEPMAISGVAAWLWVAAITPMAVAHRFRS